MSTVLVVDDDPTFLAAADRLLVAAGYSVFHATGGKEAVEILEKKHGEIDLTIMDLSLPEINGFEIIGAISRRPNPIKVIATTGVYKDYHLEVARALGAHAIIRKPPEGKPLPESEWLGTVQNLIGPAKIGKRANAASGNDPEDHSEPAK